MNDSPHGNTAASTNAADAPRASGRRVLLYLIFGIPAVLVPLLLAGTSLDRDIDLRTLVQRERTAVRVGTYNIVKFDERIVDQWPTHEVHPYVRGELNAPTRPTPSAFAREVLGTDPEPRWTSTFRGMPFAVFWRVDNPRVMNDSQRALVELRVVAASVFDPANDADREVLRQLDEALSQTAFVTGEEPAPRKRRRASYTPPTKGEALAKRLLDAILELPEGPGRKEAAREILRQAVGKQALAGPTIVARP